MAPVCPKRGSGSLLGSHGDDGAVIYTLIIIIGETLLRFRGKTMAVTVELITFASITVTKTSEGNEETIRSNSRFDAPDDERMRHLRRTGRLYRCHLRLDIG